MPSVDAHGCRRNSGEVGRAPRRYSQVQKVDFVSEARNCVDVTTMSQWSLCYYWEHVY